MKIGVTKFGELTGITRATLAKWAKQGRFDTDNGMLDPAVAARQIVARASRKIPQSTLDKLSRATGTKLVQGEVEEPGGPTRRELTAGKSYQRTIADENLRLARAKADQAEIKAAQMAGDLLEKVEVIRLWADQYTRIRSRLMTIGADLADDLAVANDPKDCEVLVKRAITEALEALSEYSPGVR